MDLPEGTTARNPKDYVVKLYDAQSILVQATEDYLKRNQRKRGADGGLGDVEVTKFSAGDYVLRYAPPLKDSRLPRRCADTLICP